MGTDNTASSFFSDQSKFKLPASLEDQVNEEVPRDRWGRPMIRQADGTELPYNRASSFGGQIEDSSNIAKWGKRQMLRGAAIDPSIVSRVPDGPARTRGADVSKKEKSILDSLVTQADEAVGSGDKAILGTAIHLASERVDLGDDLSVFDDHPLRRLLIDRADAYHRAIQDWGIRWNAVETFVVHDDLQVAGTFDRRGDIPWWPETVNAIGDVKTSSTMAFAGISFATQLALYAHSREYDFKTGERRAHEDMNLQRAIIIHVSREMGGPVELYEVNIELGARYMHLVREVILARREGRKAIREITEQDQQIHAISLCSTVPDLLELWRTFGDESLKPAFTQRRIEIEGGAA